MQHDTQTAPGAAVRGSGALHFVRHYLEMVVAMAVGMIVLGPVWPWLFGALGWPGLLDHAELHVLVMATDMTLAMAAWMRFRGHRWTPIAEMSAAMYLPFVVLFPPLWAGLVSAHTLMLAGHLLMLPAMAGVMLLRPAEYAHPHTHH